ncbi:hypothetical protein GPUN_0672 [Glaciecola punicea ACAM 611]|uniref:Lipoprotein n=1 Tax=Glaciecola punicea ACAM 611 TaxID=1121923 RepID=H5T935_9ALTE|nr:DUF1439 domain-containing protein [Glaciecola punicea]GAB54812.1 hypothetical protein GPUN_0672 [Glaciecola punicea ACAM 611]
MRILLILSALMLSACTSTQGLSVYSFSNEDIESVLIKQLPKLSENVNLMGLPVKFALNDLDVVIGPGNRDVVLIRLDTSAIIDAFAFTYPVGLKLQVQGSPFYDSQKKAIFLRDVSLLDSSIDAGRFRGNLGTLNNEAISIINAFLAQNPVYTLNSNDPKIVLLSKLPLDLKVENGAINIIPRL